ncbi:MAG: type II toxin-antitoxin system prevent-host-death family antitoxin [Actinobacteria bacterium]|nr:type II toxin-antitoxin system prevent-host-death family antitoxin [Actinomycetota bacterium]
MTTVGVRELRQRASELLRRVEQGETIEVTDRGRPVAVLAPIPDRGSLAELRAMGQLEPPSADIADIADPLPIPAAGPSASEVLAALRRDER